MTQRGNRLYLHIFSWPLETLYLNGLADRVDYAQLLHDGSEISIQLAKNDDGYTAPNTLEVRLPIQRPDVLVPVVELFLK